jgi:hypothetical protein
MDVEIHERAVMLTAPPLTTYQEHIHAAIAVLQTEITTLENAGTRPGCLMQSITGGKYPQWHWVHQGKRVYVALKNKAAYQAEIERSHEVEALRAKVALLHQAL